MMQAMKEEMVDRRICFKKLKRGTICSFGVDESGERQRVFLIKEVYEVGAVDGIELTPTARELILAGRPCPFVRVPYDEMDCLNILGG